MLQNKLDVSIEFAHLYAAQGISRSQLISAEILNEEINHLRSQGKQFSSVILVDDINGQPFLNNRQQIAENLRAKLGNIDRLVFESELLAACKVLLRSLDKNELFFRPFNRAFKKVLFLKTKDRQIALAEFKDKKFKPTCACFVAAWHLIRLGAINSLDFLPAQFSVSILEEKYRDVEEKAKLIIRTSEHKEYADRVLHQFYQI